MTVAPPPPERFTAPARAAWHRLHAHVDALGQWDELYITALELASSACATYLSLAATYGPGNHLAEAWRLSARKGLADFLFIEHERIPLANLTPTGLDADISRVCEPIESQQP